MDFKQEEFNISKIEFEIYSKLSGNNLVKLNKSLCNDCSIFFLVPILITGNIDKLNSSSGYFKDICYTATSDSGTDITLLDRRKELINSNQITCQENCEFSEYNYTTHRANCSCKVEESSIWDYMNIDKTKLFENFANFKNIANVNILKCYDNLFNKKGIIKNVGFYVISFIIIFSLISVFIFYLKQKYIIKQNIDKLDNKINANFNMIINGNQKKSNENKINNIIENNNINIFNKRKKRKSKKRKKKNNKKNNNTNFISKENKPKNIIQNNNTVFLGHIHYLKNSLRYI